MHAFIAEKEFAKKHGIKLEYDNKNSDEDEKSEDESPFELSSEANDGKQVTHNANPVD